TMEPPAGTDAEARRDEKVKVLRAIPPLDAHSIVRGQFKGYRNEKGVAADSQVETFAAIRLMINSWRWQGVPFYIRAGKFLPVPGPEVLVELGRPPALVVTNQCPPNFVRFRISPDVSISLGAMAMKPGERMEGGPVELLASHHPSGDEMDAYERLLGDAMRG